MKRIGTLLTIIISILAILVPIAWNIWQTRTKLELRLVASSSFSAPSDQSFRKDLMVSFRSQKVDNLAKYRFSLVNTGTNIIDKSAVREFPGFPIPDKARVLYASVSDTKPDGIVAQIRLEPTNAVSVEFDFLNPSDSVNFDMYFDGQLPDVLRPSGRIKGVKSVEFVDMTVPTFDKRVVLGYTHFQEVVTRITAALLTGSIALVLFRFILPRRRRRQELLAKPELLTDLRTSDDLKKFVNTFLDFTPKFVRRQLVEKIDQIDLTRVENVELIHDEIAAYYLKFAKHEIPMVVGGLLGGLVSIVLSFMKLFTE